ncbi:MAG: electron transfer flavoprotein [Denitrovibrio sp.]|nr:MAG: electron transfer flavoprotein [Denitrovibrio sp.]
MYINNTVFIIFFVASMLFFAYSCYVKLGLVKLGTATDRTSRPGKRFAAMLKGAFGQSRVMKEPHGSNHAILFWAFLVLLVLNAEFLLNGLFPSITFNLLPAGIYSLVMSVFDIVSVLVLTSVLVALKRKLFHPPFPEARTFEAFGILGMIGGLMIAYFLSHGAEIALGYTKGASLFSGVVAAFLATSSREYVEAVAFNAWWAHAAILFAFINYLPYSRHIHILTAIPNVYFKNLDKPVMMEREVSETGNKFGVSKVNEFTWKDLLDSFTCTDCGRCQENCPAHLTKKPLNPRELMVEIKENLNENGKKLKDGEVKYPLIGRGLESVSEDEIWACLTCGACMEVCPVFIEHVPKLIKLRRHLVQAESKFPQELMDLFSNMEQQSNPWGKDPAERVKWSSSLNIKEFSEDTEYLLYIGCAGSFDSRNKKITVALTQILDKAGVSYGTLGKDELCCGDSARRLGNESLFEKMANSNTELLMSKGVKKVITQCPHCFTTLKNDYRQYGLELEVIHHSEFIDKLIKEGKLELRYKADQKIVFHDSCYLGRHNGVYEKPREVIASTGVEIIEMERNYEKSFCCGAGGGRMWMEEDMGSRVNEDRLEQALQNSPDSICVSCPYCMTMFENGLKNTGKNKVKVQDIAEVTAKALL